MRRKDMWIYVAIIAVAILAFSSCSRQKEHKRIGAPLYYMRKEKQLVWEKKQWSVDEVGVQAIEKKVIEIISEQMGADKSEIRRETSFINDLNADSLDTVELVMEFEDEFDMSIPDGEAEKIQTVGAAIDYIINSIQRKETRLPPGGLTIYS
jgi:acyl carrier protein